jgi:hypothetical protein
MRVCGAPLAATGREVDPFRFCERPARWTHDEGCSSKDRCGRHIEGGRCRFCGNDVRPIERSLSDG